MTEGDGGTAVGLRAAPSRSGRMDGNGVDGGDCGVDGGSCGDGGARMVQQPDSGG